MSRDGAACDVAIQVSAELLSKDRLTVCNLLIDWDEDYDRKWKAFRIALAAIRIVKVL